MISANKMPVVKRRRALGHTASVLALTAMVASACGSSPAASAKKSTPKHVTLTYLSLFSTPPMSTLQQTAATQFEHAHPGVTVRLLTAPSGSTFAKFQTLASAGTAPDIYMAQGQYFPALLGHNVLAPVDYKAIGFANLASLKSTYIRGILSPYMSKKKLYGVPEEVSNYQNWVNVKDFKQAGLAVPTTWQQVCADGPKLTRKVHGKITQEEVALPTGLPGGQYNVLNTIALEYGKPLFNSTGTVSNLTSKPAVDALTMLQNLVYKCHAAYPALNGGTHGAGRAVYMANEAGMMFTGGSWFYGSLKSGAKALLPPVSGVYPFPAPASGTSTSTSYGYAWVVAKASHNQRLAWEFVKALRSQAPQVFKAIGLTDGEKTVGSTSATAAAVPFWRQAWLPSLAKAHYQADLLNSTQIDSIIGKAMDQVIEAHANVQATLKTANQAVVPLLNKS